MFKKNQKGIIDPILVVILVVVFAVGGFIYWKTTQKDDEKITQSSQVADSQTTTKESEAEVTEPMNEGWVRYESKSQKISFEYPKGWFVSEDENGDISIKNQEGDINKGNAPEGFQYISIDTSADSIAFHKEDDTKNGKPSCCYQGGDVQLKSSVVKNGDFSINLYEYQTVGGPSTEAYWSNPSTGKKYFANHLTEWGDQEASAKTLKLLLPTILLIN